MAMTNPTQLAALKADIVANPTLEAKPNTPDGNLEIADYYNADSSPAFYVWRTNVSISETGQAFNGTELAGLTTGNNTRLQSVAMYLADGYNAALADVRQMFNDIWSGAGGTTTRANLLVIWRRVANRVEKLLATGTGSTASPAVMSWEGPISYTDVQNARNS